jgi:glycine/D-amino acid oxidase-like deaminating enzyme
MSAVVEGADVIVIGAGVHGASLAFHLACRGTRVVIVERSTAAGGATGRSSGLVRMHYDLPVEALLAWASFPWFRDWPDRVGGECGFVRTGFLWLEAAEMADRLRANVATQQGLGIATSFVEAGIRRLALRWRSGTGTSPPTSRTPGTRTPPRRQPASCGRRATGGRASSRAPR